MIKKTKFSNHPEWAC